MPPLTRVMPRRVMSALSALAAVVLTQAAVALPAVADDMRSKQWYLDAMQAEAMWKVSRGEGITVAVIDSGVDASVPELAGQTVDGTDVSSTVKGPTVDLNGHGTNMATLIAGTGAKGGIQGLAPGAKVMPVRVEHEVGLVDAPMGRAIRYAVDHGARVINVSMGQGGSVAPPPKTAEAVKYALSKGSLIFAAAGNDGERYNVESYPASLPGVVSIAATDENGTVTKFSNSASHVALASPGDEIPGRCEKGAGFCAGSGTSQATAIASASAALIWAKHPDWTNNQVLRVMMDTAGKPTDGTVPSAHLGYGIVRPRVVLLDGEGDPGPADVNPLLAARASAEPESSKKPSPNPSPSGDDKAQKKTTVAQHPDAGSDGGRSVLGPAIGIGAVLVTVTVVAIVVARNRGRTAQR
ncbi:type VII secretion-associated serine protease [Streptomyces mashuensis]|uniref:Type VII secretion-associated serine protease n=1 Tax=Streptomyces mashuensis TaxID=33904 RepID=A0A919B9V7_9ACTN|nr:S8 family serine peptidase [Streptomyces mashuensis]GHF74742.1 type VII secretion-associated serine protease [Streptomyces mashuensis]